MFSLLRQPYPPPVVSPAKGVMISCGIGAFVALFLIAFKPFGTDRSTIPNLNLFLAGYGVITALVTLLPVVLLPRVWPGVFSEDKWTVGRHMLFNFLVVFLGITVSYFYLLLPGGEANLKDYFYFFRIGLLIASFPIVVITLIDYIRKLRHYERGSQSVNLSGRQSVPVESNLIVLTDDRDRPEVSLEAGRVWCLHSDGNYVEVWFANDEGAYERLLIRNTLARLSEQLPEELFLTCHRSWIVNPTLVEEVTGNAQGYRLHREGAPVVAVARGRSEIVLAKLKVGT